MTHRERFMAALTGEPVDRVPVFPLLMSLAADRAGISYREFASNGSALAQAQLLVQERFGLDAITACSDAFRLSGDLGGDIAFPEETPPYLRQPLLRDSADLRRLGRPDPTASGSRMLDRCHAISEMAKAVSGKVAVLGWVDMPFAEACSLCGVSDLMLMLVDDPALAHRILEFITGIVIDFGIAQVQAGADMIGAGDAAASLVSPTAYRTFALPYEQRVTQAIHDAGSLVKLHICGNTANLLEDMARSGADIFNVDHMVPLSRAVEVYSRAGKCLKGNLDPVSEMLQVTPEECTARARHCIHVASGAKYMLSPGCEVPAATPDEVLQAFCLAPQQALLDQGGS